MLVGKYPAFPTHQPCNTFHHAGAWHVPSSFGAMYSPVLFPSEARRTNPTNAPVIQRSPVFLRTTKNLVLKSFSLLEAVDHSSSHNIVIQSEERNDSDERSEESHRKGHLMT